MVNDVLTHAAPQEGSVRVEGDPQGGKGQLVSSPAYEGRHAAVPALAGDHGEDQHGSGVPSAATASCQAPDEPEKPLVETTHCANSNTTLAILQGPTCKCRVNWISLSFYIEWAATVWISLRRLLTKAKYTARCKGSQLITFGGYQAQVLAYAPELGGRQGQIRTAFFLVIEGVRFLMGDRRVAAGHAPNLIVQATGLQCLRFTLQEILVLVRSVIRLAGGVIVTEKLSRVDLASDILDQPIDPFWQACLQNRFVTRTKHHRQIGGSEGRTLYFGEIPLTLCIYDKKAQLKTKSDLQVSEEAYYLHRLWGTNFVTDVTRVEFRLFRDTLRQHGIDSPADFQGKLPDLIKYLTGRWFRFTAGPVDRMNTARALTLPLWAQVAAGFQNWAGAPQGASLAPLPKLPLATEQLAKQLLGLALTHAARVHGRALTVVETLDHARAVLAQEIVRINLQEAYATRLA